MANLVGNVKTNQARHEKLGLFGLGNVFLSAGNFYKDDKGRIVAIPGSIWHWFGGDNDIELFSEFKGRWILFSF